MRGSERFAALRIGWVLSPECLVHDLTQAKLDADRGSPGIDQLALSEFIRCSHPDWHLRRTRLIDSRRRALLAAALGTHLPGLAIRGVAAGGLHLTLELLRGSDEAAIVAEARRRGMDAYGLSSYRARPELGPPALLLGYYRRSEGRHPRRDKGNSCPGNKTRRYFSGAVDG
jgi:GntR family transcriptional regulator/MocR family aminotransferase